MWYGKETIGKDCRDLESDCNDKSRKDVQRPSEKRQTVEQHKGGL